MFKLSFAGVSRIVDQKCLNQSRITRVKLNGIQPTLATGLNVSVDMLAIGSFSKLLPTHACTLS